MGEWYCGRETSLFSNEDYFVIQSPLAGDRLLTKSIGSMSLSLLYGSGDRVLSSKEAIAPSCTIG